MKTLLFILLVSSEIKISNIVSNANSIKLNFEQKIVKLDNFYHEIISSYSNQNKIVIYDSGNKYVSVFSPDGEFVNGFGQEGNGPGELFQINDVYSNDEYIYLKSTRKIIIFKFDGTFVKEIKKNISFGFEIILSENILSVYYSRSFLKKYYRVDYTFAGKLLKTYSNSNLKIDTNITNRFFNYPRDLIKVKQGYLRFHPGEYRLELLDDDYNVTSNYKMDYTRKKEHSYPTWLQEAIRKDGANKERIIKRNKFLEMRKKANSGYLSDIISILGTLNGFIFIQTSSASNNEMNIDVLTDEFKLYDQLSLETEEILSARIENNKLLLNLKNDDIGPYLKIFSIKFKE